MRFQALHDERTLTRLYWSMRLGIAFIWLWTAFVSWYVHPHADSIGMLRKAGITVHTAAVFAASCALDLAMGVASLIYARAWLWRAQFLLVAGYTVVICCLLPEFLMHPFGAITKNLTVLICLAMLSLADQR